MQSGRQNQPLIFTDDNQFFHWFRNAFRMIELLLKDHNLLIGEIVDRVMAPQRKSPSLSSSSESSHHPSAPPSRPQPMCTPPSAPCSPMTITTGKLIITPQEEMKKMPVFPVPKSGPSPLASGQTPMQNCCSTTPTTNVWQKRAEAIREKKSINFYIFFIKKIIF